MKANTTTRKESRHIARQVHEHGAKQAKRVSLGSIRTPTTKMKSGKEKKPRLGLFLLFMFPFIFRPILLNSNVDVQEHLHQYPKPSLA